MRLRNDVEIFIRIVVAISSTGIIRRSIKYHRERMRNGRGSVDGMKEFDKIPDNGDVACVDRSMIRMGMEGRRG